MKTSIIDLPREANEKDTFGIDSYQKGLIEFTTHAATPITIALQGEWGSGKTSLMNTLKRDLCGDDGPYHEIWLNTWEYALMKDAESALAGILSGLIEQIMSIFNQDESRTKKMLFNLGKAVGTIASNIAVTQANKAVDSAGDAFAAFKNSFTSNSDGAIGTLRDELERTIDTCIKGNKVGKKGVVFFIDDLDRIDPPVAVQLLELLKNIFSLNHCVFILAIDYDVVVKGLEPKFGKLCEANEREFRSFFDKIIQLPFSMPVSSYNIDKFLTENLKEINYLNAEQVANKELTDFVTQAANFTVGNNPRSLKRLLNSLSLISCINRATDKTKKVDEDDDPVLDLQVNFALVSIQVAYPTIYSLIEQKPNFNEWDEQAALEFSLERLSDDVKQQISTNEEFDEAWEHVVFQACQADSFLRNKSLSISRHLNSLKALIESKGETVGEVVGSVISLSSVTSVNACNKVTIDYHRGNLLKHSRWLLMEELKKKIPELVDQIQPQGKRVQTNAYLKLTENDWEHTFHFLSYPHDGKIRLKINAWFHLMEESSLDEVMSKLSDFHCREEFDKIINDFKVLLLRCELIGNPFDNDDIYFCDKNTFYVRMDVFVDLTSASGLDEMTLIWESLSTTMVAIYRLRLRLVELKKKIEQAEQQVH